MKLRIVLLALAIAGTTGCATVKGWFGGESSKSSKKANEPAELTDIAQTLSVREVWSRSVGKGEEDLGYRIRPAQDGSRLYAVDAEGRVLALDPANGKELWEADLFRDQRGGRGWRFWRSRVKEKGLTSSVGVGASMLAVGGRNGEVFALDPSTGALKWKVKVGAETIAAPFVGGDRVVVHLNDGRVLGLDTADGSRKWSFIRSLPSLTLRGSAAPIGAQGLVFVGTDDGKVVALSEADGRVLWEQTIAEPEGRTELDRISDVDGDIQIGEQEIYVNSFGNQMLVMGAVNGRPLWAKDIGSAHGAAIAGDKILVSDKAGVVWGLDRSTGSVLWKQEALQRRQLTGPVLHGSHAVVADLEGYLHWIKLDDGSIVARDRVSRSVIRAMPIVGNDGLLITQTTEGDLSAYRLQ